MSYSEEMIQELKNKDVWNYESATAFAKKHMQKPRSVTAKIISLGLTYEKATVAKATPKTPKATLVAAINSSLGVSALSLDKVNIADLNLILGALNDR